MRLFKYALQALPIYFLYGFFRVLPLDVASSTGAFLMKRLGPFFRKRKVAEKNLRLAFPDKSETEIQKIMTGMWENLGRVLGEFPHLSRVKIFTNPSRIKVVGEEAAQKIMDEGKPVLLFGGHFANWEVSSLLTAIRGISLHRIYRISNNPFIEKLVVFSRRKVLGDLLPKGKAGARRLKELLNEGAPLGMLVDQKFNRGEMMPFFGRPAPCLTSFIEFGYSHGYKLIPTRVERTKGAHFVVTAYPPIQLKELGDKKENIRDVLTQVNTMFEAWIRERPEQWLWIHNRWPKEN